ncbi:MAG TPA: GNAT family N-acetyltransferase [Alphaproteobacteria bacterium]|nr:GNAT family N-acetyltransferase [Alphaproteobacteria bacterium]
MIVKLAETKDIRDLVRLDERCGDGQPYYEAWLWQMHIQNRDVLIGIEENKIIGAIRVEDNGGSVLITDVMVDPEYQGRGYGKKLFESALAIADSQNKPQWLHVSPDNNRAIRLYESFGFSASGQPNLDNFFDIEMVRQPYAHIFPKP